MPAGLLLPAGLVASQHAGRSTFSYNLKGLPATAGPAMSGWESGGASRAARYEANALDAGRAALSCADRDRMKLKALEAMAHLPREPRNSRRLGWERLCSVTAQLALRFLAVFFAGTARRASTRHRLAGRFRLAPNPAN